MSGKKSDVEVGERGHACNLCQLTSLYTHSSPPPPRELEMLWCQMLPLRLLPMRDGTET